MKINIESFDRDIFEKICPDLDYDGLLRILAQAVSVFGKGKVTTNILIGLGETNENVLEGVEHFARLGIVPVIRVLRINDTNYLNIINALGYDISRVSPDRMLELAGRQKEILQKYGLSTGSFATMCHRCGCCDIVPFIDL
jgi:biotin synthase-related radical SAM superfamily protein